MESYLIRNARIVNSGKTYISDILLKNGRIEKIASSITNIKHAVREIDADAKYVFPGIIDCHVHFREPGLTYKADIATESRAAVAGGVTTCLEMPNTDPKTTTVEELLNKYALAEEKSLVNLGFFIGATNNNQSEIEQAKKAGACGIKLFLGASTGNMLVDNSNSIEWFFKNSDLIITIHSEDEQIINENLIRYQEQYGEQIPAEAHAEIRSAEACYKASRYAVELSQKYNTRIHLAHLSTEKELSLLKAGTSKKITSEVSVHHLIYNQADYSRLGNLIKCNPSVKSENDQEALLRALNDGVIDIIATDHAPHTIAEKSLEYINCPSGIPFVQHSLSCLLEMHDQNLISVERIIESMCHRPAEIYGINNRGYLEEGYFADLCILSNKDPFTVYKNNILYKCGWSPLEGSVLKNKVVYTFVNGNLVYENGTFHDQIKGMKPSFM
jgi:dihydroorotase